MAIRWRPIRKRGCVKRALREHPAQSSRCDRAAVEILPIARTQDAGARLWLLRAAPECGPAACILAKGISNPPRWAYHVCVEAQVHCVCALTGAGGTPSGQYIDDNFQYPEMVRPIPVEDAEALHTALDRMRPRRGARHG